MKKHRAMKQKRVIALNGYSSTSELFSAIRLRCEYRVCVVMYRDQILLFDIKNSLVQGQPYYYVFSYNGNCKGIFIFIFFYLRR